MSNETSFETFLVQQNEEAWASALATLMRSIHEVDRNATQIWFAFYPLTLFSALEAAKDREKLAHELLLQGDYDLKTQIDTSHDFLYGHRFWPQVKRAVSLNASAEKQGVGRRVSGAGNANQELTGNSSGRLSSEQGLSQHPTTDTQHPDSPKLADERR